jgi:hypothetical protein
MVTRRSIPVTQAVIMWLLLATGVVLGQCPPLLWHVGLFSSAPQGSVLCTDWIQKIMSEVCVHLSFIVSRSDCGLRRRSAAEWLLVMQVRIPLKSWIYVSCVCCVGSGFCDEVVTLSEELWLGARAVRLNCNLETLTMRLPTQTLDCCAKEEKKPHCLYA